MDWTCIMADTTTTSDDELLRNDADAALVARYSRLAGETTGMGRRILLRLADEARARQQHARAGTIDLHLVLETSASSPDAIRTYR